MKKTALFVSVCMALLLAVLLSACGNSSGVKGRWAYNHDKETLGFQLTSKKAVLDGTEYKVEEIGGNAVVLSLNGEKKSFRYELTDAGMYLYKPTDYVLQDGEKADGLVGIWVNAENNWSFEFTADGTFREDEYFPGQYTVNESEGSFKLAYNDHFEDTVCYYSISGNVLTVEYPWPMVRMG